VSAPAKQKKVPAKKPLVATSDAPAASVSVKETAPVAGKQRKSVVTGVERASPARHETLSARHAPRRGSTPALVACALGTSVPAAALHHEALARTATSPPASHGESA
jgi:hypothetical protein